MIDIILCSLVVFAVTLTVTKASITAGKREFVTHEYEVASKVNKRASFIHRWWYKIWTCPMCCGFWVSLWVAYLYPCPPFGARYAWCAYMGQVLVMYGVNWLLHCGENYLFQISEKFSKENGDAQS